LLIVVYLSRLPGRAPVFIAVLAVLAVDAAKLAH